MRQSIAIDRAIACLCATAHGSRGFCSWGGGSAQQTALGLLASNTPTPVLPSAAYELPAAAVQACQDGYLSSLFIPPPRNVVYLANPRFVYIILCRWALFFCSLHVLLTHTTDGGGVSLPAKPPSPSASSQPIRQHPSTNKTFFLPLAGWFLSGVGWATPQPVENLFGYPRCGVVGRQSLDLSCSSLVFSVPHMGPHCSSFDTLACIVGFWIRK